MTDVPEKKPVVDSRQPGFDPEVEASHAAAAAKAAAPPPAPEPAPAPQKRTTLDVLDELLSEVVAHLGNHPRLVALLQEYKKL